MPRSRRARDRDLAVLAELLTDLVGALLVDDLAYVAKIGGHPAVKAWWQRLRAD
ncbi:MAG: hypothetical protein R3B09_23860 [Nannocystaceae bacterium]